MYVRRGILFVRRVFLFKKLYVRRAVLYHTPRSFQNLAHHLIIIISKTIPHVCKTWYIWNFFWCNFGLMRPCLSHCHHHPEKLKVTRMTAPDQTTGLPDPHIATIHGIFSFSPFGLGCRLCPKEVSIQMNEKCIRDHVKKHGMDSRVLSIRSLFETYRTQLEAVRAVGSMEAYRMDKIAYKGFSCLCGQVFPRKDNACRHCQRRGCDSSLLQEVVLIKLCCGQFVSDAQVKSFFLKKS